jgi:hypothetical protein
VFEGKENLKNTLLLFAKINEEKIRRMKKNMIS